MSQTRMIALDGTRGIAALSVLLFHTLGPEFYTFAHLYIAVDFFFILSGFVLAPSFARVINLNTALLFLRSRFLRIFPMVLAIITFTVIYDLLLIGKHQILGETHSKPIILSIPTLIFSLLILQVFYKPAVLVDYPIWSLSAEWVANILVAAVDRVFQKKTTFSVILGGLMIICSAPLDSEVLNQIGRAVWGFSIGLIAFEYQGVYFKHGKSLKVIAALILPVYISLPLLAGYQSLISIWPFVAGIIILSQQRVSINLSKVCTFLGKYSYGFYLWHFPMLSLVGFLLGDLKVKSFSLSVSILEITLTALLSLVATRISLEFIEVPIRRRWK